MNRFGLEEKYLNFLKSTLKKNSDPAPEKVFSGEKTVKTHPLPEEDTSGRPPQS